MEIEKSSIELRKLKIDSVVDIAYNRQNIFLLSKKQLIIFSLDFIKRETTKLENPNGKAVKLLCDDLFVYIGFVNGTIEVRDLQSPHNLILITEETDAGGPGNSTITDMCSTKDLLLVSTKENGLLVYLKPVIAFYKWLMISGFTSIIDFTISNNKIFVITKERTIHLLDLVKGKVFDLDNLGVYFPNLNSNHEFLCLYSPTILRIYDINNYNLVWQLKVKDEVIVNSALFNDFLLVLFSSNYIRIYDTKNKFDLIDEKKTTEHISLKWFKRTYLNPSQFNFSNNNLNVIYFDETNLYQLKLSKND